MYVVHMNHTQGDQNSPLWLKKKPYESRSLWNNTWSFVSSLDAEQTKECMTCCSPFYESRWWVSMMMKVGLCFAQIMHAMSLLSVPVRASIPRTKGADCGMCPSERPAAQASLSLELCQPGDYTWTNTYAASDCKSEQRANQHDNVDVPPLYSSAWLWTQAPREGCCSLQQSRTKGTLQLLEHEADSCSAACTNIAMCYLLLRLDFKTMV